MKILEKLYSQFLELDGLTYFESKWAGDLAFKVHGSGEVLLNQFYFKLFKRCVIGFIDLFNGSELTAKELTKDHFKVDWNFPFFERKELISLINGVGAYVFDKLDDCVVSGEYCTLEDMYIKVGTDIMEEIALVVFNWVLENKDAEDEL